MSQLFQVNQNLKKIVAQLLERTEETLDEDINTLKAWISSQPHLPEMMDDIKIANFFLLNKGSIERTKQKIDMYYTIRSLIPEFYDEANPSLPHMTNFMETSHCVIHPKLIEDKYRVFFVKVRDPNQTTLRHTTMQICNIQEIRLYEDCMVGDIVIADMEDLGLNLLVHFTPTFIAKTFTIFEKIYSLRIKAIYLLNSSSHISKFTALLKTLIKPKIFNRIQVCQNADVLKQLFSNDDLPKDYGGEGPSLVELNGMLKEKFEEYRERFDRLDKLRVDESVRPKELNNDEILGFYGNFKKLNVD